MHYNFVIVNRIFIYNDSIKKTLRAKYQFTVMERERKFSREQNFQLDKSDLNLFGHENLACPQNTQIRIFMPDQTRKTTNNFGLSVIKEYNNKRTGKKNIHDRLDEDHNDGQIQRGKKVDDQGQNWMARIWRGLLEGIRNNCGCPVKFFKKQQPQDGTNVQTCENHLSFGPMKKYSKQKRKKSYTNSSGDQSTGTNSNTLNTLAQNPSKVAFNQSALKIQPPKSIYQFPEIMPKRLQPIKSIKKFPKSQEVLRNLELKTIEQELKAQCRGQYELEQKNVKQLQMHLPIQNKRITDEEKTKQSLEMIQIVDMSELLSLRQLSQDQHDSPKNLSRNHQIQFPCENEIPQKNLSKSDINGNNLQPSNVFLTPKFNNTNITNEAHDKMTYTPTIDQSPLIFSVMETVLPHKQPHKLQLKNLRIGQIQHKQSPIKDDSDYISCGKQKKTETKPSQQDIPAGKTENINPKKFISKNIRQNGKRKRSDKEGDEDESEDEPQQRQKNNKFEQFEHKCQCKQKQCRDDQCKCFRIRGYCTLQCGCHCVNFKANYKINTNKPISTKDIFDKNDLVKNEMEQSPSALENQPFKCSLFGALDDPSNINNEKLAQKIEIEGPINKRKIHIQTFPGQIDINDIQIQRIEQTKDEKQMKTDEKISSEHEKQQAKKYSDIMYYQLQIVEENFQNNLMRRKTSEKKLQIVNDETNQKDPEQGSENPQVYSALNILQIRSDEYHQNEKSALGKLYSDDEITEESPKRIPSNRQTIKEFGIDVYQIPTHISKQNYKTKANCQQSQIDFNQIDDHKRQKQPKQKIIKKQKKSTKKNRKTMLSQKIDVNHQKS